MSTIPYPENAPGDFYVEKDCCTLCAVPFEEAPELFAWAPNPESPTHCYICRQPQTTSELGHMIMAIRVAELQCIHYSGNDLVIQTQLVELGEGMVCDNLPPDLRRKAQRMESEKLRRWRQAKHASIWMAILNWFGYRR